MTKTESIFWEGVRGKQLLGLRVKRQYGIGPYILDFYIPGKRIAIEIDGGVHQVPEIKVKDKNKDAFLSENGISVIRIDNEEVINDRKEIIESLKSLIPNITDPICLPLLKGKDPFQKTRKQKQ